MERAHGPVPIEHVSVHQISYWPQYPPDVGDADFLSPIVQVLSDFLYRSESVASKRSSESPLSPDAIRFEPSVPQRVGQDRAVAH